MLSKWRVDTKDSFELGVATWKARTHHGVGLIILKMGPNNFLLEINCSPSEYSAKIIHRSTHATLSEAQKMASFIVQDSTPLGR